LGRVYFSLLPNHGFTPELLPLTVYEDFHNFSLALSLKMADAVFVEKEGLQHSA
jgi:hypothetical protein